MPVASQCMTIVEPTITCGRGVVLVVMLILGGTVGENKQAHYLILGGTVEKNKQANYLILGGTV